MYTDIMMCTGTRKLFLHYYFVPQFPTLLRIPYPNGPPSKSIQIWKSNIYSC